VSELRSAAAALARPVAKPPRRRKWLTRRRVAIALVVDLIVGTVSWHYLTASHPTAIAAAVESTANDAAHNNWTGVYGKLCSSDRDQTSESQFAEFGQAALLHIGELNHVTVTQVTPVSVPVGPLHWPAAEVSGDLVPVIGAPSPYTVAVIRSISGWQVCLSAGGYSSTALGVSVPLDGASPP
jgi:hypothetical protein